MADSDYEKMDIGDSFDFDKDLDMDFSDDFDPPPIKDDRNVIAMTSSEFAKAGMGRIKDPANLSKLVRGALPKEMNAVVGMADDTLTSVTRTYEDAKEQIKGPLRETKRSLRALKSSFGKILPDKIDKWLDGILSDEDNYGGMRETKEQMQENQIASVLAENFKWQAEQAQEENVKEELRATTETELNRKQALFLGRIAASTQRLNDYNDGPNLGYQRKMLEINYRQLFAQQGLYEETKLLRQEFLQELKSITKNTSLPDLVKQKKSEVIKDIGFRRLVSFGQKTFNSQINSYFPKMGENFSNLIKSKVGDVNELLSFIQQAADASTMANSDEFSFGEQKYDESDSRKLARKTAGMAGDMVAGSLMGKLGSIIGRKFGENKHVKKVTTRMGRFYENPQYFVNKLIKEGVTPSKLREILPEFVSNGVDDLFRAIKPSLQEASGSVGYYTPNNINEIAEFDNRTRLTITDIIPGYLARILQSSEGIRVGTLPPLQVYSHERGGFVTSRELTTDIKSKLFSDYKKESLKKDAQDQAKLIFGKEFEGDEKELWEKAMLTRARNFQSSDIEELMEANAFGKEIPKEIQDKWRREIAARFGWDNEKRKVTKNDVDTNNLMTRIFEASTSMMRRLGEPVVDIQRLNEGGLFYTEALKDAGLVKEGENKHAISLENYYDQLIHGDHKANDELKKHIHSGRQPVGVGTPIPQPVSKTKSKGRQNEFHSDLAGGPSGDKLLTALSSLRDGLLSFRDVLLSRDTVTSAATQDQTFVEKLYAQDQTHREGQTTRIVEAIGKQIDSFKVDVEGLGTKMYSGFYAGLDALTASVTSMIASVGKVQVDDAVIERWEKFRQASRSNWDKGVEFVGNRVKSIGQGLAKLPSKIKSGSATFFDKLGDVTKFAYNQAKKPLAGIAELFNNQIREDIFVLRAGKLVRALFYSKLVAGAYYDQKTGKPIEKFEQIRGPVKEIGADGKTVTDVLTEEDLQFGLYNMKGEKFSTSRFKGLGLKLFSFAKDKLVGFNQMTNPLQVAKRALTFAKESTKSLYGLVLDDIFVGDETTPRIFKRAILNGEYQDVRGNILSPRHFESLSSDVYVKDPTSPTGRKCILTLAEATEKGLFDSAGRPFKALMGRIKGIIKKPWELAKGAINRGKNAVKGVVNTIFNAGKFLKRGLTLDMYPKFIYELLAWKFGAPEHHQEALKGGSLFTLPTNLFKRVKSLFVQDKVEQAKEKAKAIKEKAWAKLEKEKQKALVKARREAQRLKRRTGSSTLRRKYDEVKEKVNALREKQFILLSRSKEGLQKLVDAGNGLRGMKLPSREEMRQKAAEARKSLSEKFAQLRQKRKEMSEKAKAKREAIRKWSKEKSDSIANRVGGWRDALKRRKDKPKKTLKERFRDGKEGMSKFLKTTVAGIGLTLLKLYNWAKKGFGLKSLLGSIVKGVGGLGKGILNVARLLGNGVVGAARVAGQVAVGAGRLAIAAAPAIASTVAAGASAAAGGLAAAGTFLLTNPVGWVILGVAIGYGIWRWFKDDFEPLDRFRLLAYGLVPEDHKDQANKLLAFEKEVWKETRFDESGKPTLDEIDYQKWAGLFWDETAGQPTQDAWVKHVQRFENWFNKRFRPTYMKHVAALKQIDPKIEPYDMDDDLDDGQKPGFARKAFFDKAELGQTPYDFLESPFTDVKALDANYNHLEHQRNVILAKYGEDEARLKRIAKGEKTLGDKIKTVALLGIFDDNQEEAKAKLAFEERDTYKDMSAKLATETKKGGEMMIGSLTQIELTDKDGKKKFVTLEESGYKLPESSNEFEFLNMMMLGMPAEVSRADYELLREVEYQVSLKLVKHGKGYAYNGEAQELIDRFITSFGWDSSNKNDQEAFGKWMTLRLIPYVCAKKKAAMLVNKNVDYPMMSQSLEFNELYDIMKSLVIEFIEIPGSGRFNFLDVPYRPFKNNLAKPDHATFAKWLEQLKNRKGKNQFKTLTDEEKKAAQKKFADGAKAEEARRKKMQETVLSEYDEERRKRNAQYTDDVRGVTTLDTSSHGYGGGDYKTNVEVGSGPVYDYTMEATNDVRGIDWQQRGEFKPHNTKGAAEYNWELVKDLFAQVAKVVGVDPGILARMAYQESKFDNNANAGTSSAKGMFQFINSTWNDYARKLATKFGIQAANIRNPVHNALAGALFLKDNLEAIKSNVQKAGLPLDSTAAYAAHFMGTGGANKFFSALAGDRSAGINTVLDSSAMKSNASIAYSGGRVKTVAEFYNTLRGMMENNKSDAFEAEARKIAGVQPKKVSDADYGKAYPNPSYQSDMTVPAGAPTSNGSLASGNYDMRDMQGSIDAAKQNGTGIAVRPGNLTTYSEGDFVQPNQAESANLKSKASVKGSGIDHNSLASEGKRLGTSFLANQREGYDPNTEYFKRQPQKTDNGKPADTDNLDPNVRENLNRLAYDYKLQTGKELTITTGYRSTEQQWKLYNDPNYKAAYPGTSLHEYGVAFDVNPSQAEEIERMGILSKYGFHRPLANDNKEKQHVQPTSVEKVPALARLSQVGDTGKGAPDVEKAAETQGGPRDIAFAQSTLAGSGVMASDVNAQAVTQQPSMRRPSYDSNNPGSSLTQTAASVAQTSIQQVMGQPTPSPSTQASVQQQQQMMMKVDKELVSTLEEVAKKQLDTLISIDGKFDKVLEQVTAIATRKPETPAGSSRSLVPQIPEEILKGPITQQRPNYRT